MNKTVIGVIVVLVVLVGGYYLLSGSNYSANPSPAPSAAPSGTPPAPSVVAPTSEVAVDLVAGGNFSPATVTIAAGTSVRFTNKDSVPHWPASGVHPTHQVCPGFDSLRPLQSGESYSFKFTVAKTCPAHDHLNPGARGTVVVQ